MGIKNLRLQLQGKGYGISGLELRLSHCNHKLTRVSDSYTGSSQDQVYQQQAWVETQETSPLTAELFPTDRFRERWSHSHQLHTHH